MPGTVSAASTAFCLLVTASCTALSNALAASAMLDGVASVALTALSNAAWASVTSAVTFTFLSAPACAGFRT